ncbi:MAG: YbbR-like domain-containing protein [Candidatus Omnitrophica bacterium]|nr:YbbR-like domain-containing protein [Candidatus Omnitrophota bacterium]
MTRKIIVFDNLFVKIISLLLAIFSWLYINSEISQSKKKEKVTLIWDKELNLEIRELPIRANIKGSPPSGYIFVESKVMVNPSYCKVVGKKLYLDSVSHIDTEPIDIRTFIKTTVVKTTLQSLSNIIVPEGEVEVTIPVERARR